MYSSHEEIVTLLAPGVALVAVRDDEPAELSQDDAGIAEVDSLKLELDAYVSVSFNNSATVRFSTKTSFEVVFDNNGKDDVNGGGDSVAEFDGNGGGVCRASETERAPDFNKASDTANEILQ
jgi:hypothetical protein